MKTFSVTMILAVALVAVIAPAVSGQNFLVRTTYIGSACSGASISKVWDTVPATCTPPATPCDTTTSSQFATLSECVNGATMATFDTPPTGFHAKIDFQANNNNMCNDVSQVQRATWTAVSTACASNGNGGSRIEECTASDFVVRSYSNSDCTGTPDSTDMWTRGGCANSTATPPVLSYRQCAPGNFISGSSDVASTTPSLWIAAALAILSVVFVAMY